MSLKKSIVYLFLTLLLTGNCFGRVSESEYDVSNSIFNAQTNKNLKDKSYLLPKKHSIHKHLRHLFKNTNMFESPESFNQEGFQIKLGHRQLMVGLHPSIPGYLFKKFTDSRSQKGQLENFIKRIEGAAKIRSFIKSHHFKHLIVPKKWLYELPPAFTKKYGRKSYILIVERMDIYQDAEDPFGEISTLYYNIKTDVLKELCTTLHGVGGCDAFPRNQPFTRSGQIAFVDTEHVGEKKLHFIKHIISALNEEMKLYALTLWAILEKQESIRKSSISLNRCEKKQTDTPQL